MKFDVVAELVGELTLLRFFPSEPSARLALVRMIGDMAESEDQVRWLVRRTLSLHNEWPGPIELRAIFCSRFKPKDGINAYSSVFADGVPSERMLKMPLPKLPPGTTASVDADAERAILQLAEAKDMNRALPAPRVPDIPLNPKFEPVTQADVEREREKLRDERARRELSKDGAA